MLLGLRVEVRGGETEVYYVDLVCLEEVFFTGFELVGVDSKIKEEVIELEVVIDEAGIVYLLEDVENLQTEGVDLSAGELHFSTKE